MPVMTGVRSAFQTCMSWLEEPSRARSAVERVSHQPSVVTGFGVSRLTCQVMELIGPGCLNRAMAAGGMASPMAIISTMG